MINQSSIKYLSSLLDNPQTVTEGDHSSIASFVQSYPYFVPARYLTALQKHKKSSFAPDMLTSVTPYMGNWILFCDFLQSGVSYGKTGDFPTPPYKEQEEVSEQYAEPAYNEPVSDTAKEEDALFDVIINDPAFEEVKLEDTTYTETIDNTQSDNTTYTEDTAEHATMVDNSVVAAAQEDPIYAETTTEQAAFADDITDNPAFPEDTASFADNAESNPSFAEATADKEDDSLIAPILTSDYFLQQGERIPDEIPGEIEELKVTSGAGDPSLATAGEEEDTSLMVMMSFSEWLMHFRDTASKQQEENKEQKALKTMWQKEKLAAAMEEENEEIPEKVFEMAVNSITQEDGLVSETLADIHIKQGKYDKAIEMYRKLSLRNPQKSAYFARKIEEILKDKQS